MGKGEGRRGWVLLGGASRGGVEGGREVCLVEVWR